MVEQEIVSLDPVKKSLISKILFVLFGLFTLSCVIGYILDIKQVLFFHSQYKTVLYLIKSPWVMVLPLVLSLSLVFLIFVTLKLKNLTKKNWTLGLVTINIFPFFYMAIVALINNALFLGLSSFVAELEKKTLNPINFFAIPVLLILVLSLPKAKESPQKLGLFEKVTLIVACVLLVVPSISIAAFQYIALTKMKEQPTAQIATSSPTPTVSIPQYVIPIPSPIQNPSSSPSSIPITLQSTSSAQPQSTEPVKINLSQLPSGFQSSADVQYDSKLITLTGAVIIPVSTQDNNVFITLVPVPVDFDLESFLKTNYKMLASKTNLTISKTGSGYLFENSNFQNSNPVALFFLTKENILIRVHSVNTPKEVIVEIAESLK